jgi:hypothetical protein
MKKFTLLVVGLAITTIAFSQKNVVTWSYKAKKIADKKYEVIMMATVQRPWHIYSQFTPSGGPVPTRISLNKNSLVLTLGKIKEAGKIINKHEDVFGADVLYFDGNAEFSQVVSLKSNVKTALSGTIEYMACTETQCLPPATISFNIPLQ